MDAAKIARPAAVIAKSESVMPVDLGRPATTI